MFGGVPHFYSTAVAAAAFKSTQDLETYLIQFLGGRVNLNSNDASTAEKLLSQQEFEALQRITIKGRKLSTSSPSPGMAGLLRRGLVHKVPLLQASKQGKTQEDFQSLCYEVSDRSLFAATQWKTLANEEDLSKALNSVCGMGFEDLVAELMQSRQDFGLSLLPGSAKDVSNTTEVQ